MQRGSEVSLITRHPSGAGILKLILSLIIMGTLLMLASYVYFSWQKVDLSSLEGRESALEVKSTDVGGVDLLKKLANARNGKYVVTLTEKEVNQYIAQKLKLKQGGALKGFSTVKGIYVDFKPDLMEVFIEREIAQYGQDGEPVTEHFKPFDHVVSMKYKIYTVDYGVGKGTSNRCEFPGAKIGQAPAPGMFMKVVKNGFDKVQKFFEKEIELAYWEVTFIKIEDGKITIDHRKRTE